MRSRLPSRRCAIDGASLDEASVAPSIRFLADGGMDGVLTCGTTGEGVLLSVPERRRMTELCLEARPEGFAVAVHAGAQTTEHTVELSLHAKEVGADAVAVIAPPYFPLDEQELFDHFRQAADACAPLPFYIYEFVGRSGYPVPLPVIERLRRRRAEPHGTEGVRHAVRSRQALPRGRSRRLHRLRAARAGRARGGSGRRGVGAGFGMARGHGRAGPPEE